MKENLIFEVLENDDPLDIRYDNVFRAVFTKETPESTGALSGLVSALIGRKVTIVSILANEQPIENLRDRQLRFDINCRAENDERINVEMCFNPKDFEPIRLEFHAAKLFIGQDIKGIYKNFDNLKQTYQIAILAKELFFPDNDFFHSFEYYDPVRQVSLNGRTRIITLELEKVKKIIIEKPVKEMNAPERWAVFLEYLTVKEKRCKINEILKLEEGIAMANQVLMKVSRDEEERARIMRDEKILLDYHSILAHDRRKIRKEEREEARREVRKEVRNERDEEIALKMKNAGEPFSKITEFTGLSLEEIEKL